MKIAVYVAGLLGVILFTELVIRSDVPGMLQTALQGWAEGRRLRAPVENPS